MESLESRRLLAVTTHDLSYYDHIDGATGLPSNGGDREWSGAAYWTDGTNEALFVLSSGDLTPNNGPPTDARIHKYSLDGTSLLQAVSMVGFSDNLEGITWRGGNDFAVVDETTGTITEFSITSSTSSINSSGPGTTTITLTGPASGIGHVDHGVEGLAYNPADSSYFVVKELTVGAIVKGVYKVTSSGHTTHVNIPIPSALVDLSDVHYAAETGDLFLLSEKGGPNEVARVDLMANAVVQIRSADIQGNAEGLTFRPDGLEMYIVADTDPPDYRRFRMRGDVDGNRGIDVGDLDAMYAAIVSGSSNTAYDLNGDNAVTDADVTLLVEVILGTWHGDADLDGDVDQADMNILGLNWLASVSSWAQGDFNGDGVVDAADLNDLGNHWLNGV